jgi:hypothetical protein
LAVVSIFAAPLIADSATHLSPERMKWYYAYYLETKSKSLFNMLDESSCIGPSFIIGEHYENLGFINYGRLHFFLRMQQ